MNETAESFIAKSTVKVADLEHRRKINFNIAKYNAVVPVGKLQFKNIAIARERAKNAKWRSIEMLDQQLEEFERQFTSRGGKVIWAEDSEEALNAIGKICAEKECKILVKSKSMVTEEIHLNAFLEKNGIESIETDLGEYIQQLDGEPPYHIVTPAMHKSKQDVARLFTEKLGTPIDLTPEELTQVARVIMREKYTQAQVGITGANFLLTDIGAIAITENEGNGRLSCSFPKTHIAVVGIEKVLQSTQDLGLFWPLLSTYGTGQKVTVYNSIITGPRQEGETDGPDEMYVILLDNGRTNLLKKETREALYCIRCGACLNACPVYKNIGGHAGLGFLDEMGGVELHGGQHGSVSMAHAFAEVGQVGFIGIAPELPGSREIPSAKRFAGFFLKAGTDLGLKHSPPDGAVQYHAEGKQEGEQNGPHDPTAFREFFDDDVG